MYSRREKPKSKRKPSPRIRGLQPTPGLRESLQAAAKRLQKARIIRA